MVVSDDDGKGLRLYDATRLYQAILSENVYQLHASTLSSIRPDSKLVVSPESIKRLHSAKLYVVVSSHSGAGLAVTSFDNLLQPLFKDLSLNATVHKTTSKTSHSEFIASISFSPDHENIIVVLGGDTVIYDIVNSLAVNTEITASHRITICPIPCGTGNALAMSLGTTSILTGISKLFGVSETSAVQTAHLPVMKITIRESDNERVIWGTVVCSWGLHASLVADSDEPEMRRQYGAQRFAVSP
jgi:diacylglycerol kinase family enzyme